MALKNNNNSGSNVVPARWNQKFGSRLKDRRELFSLSQVELAEKIGANKSTIQNYEKGDSPSGKYLALLAKELKCMTGWLLMGEGTEPDPPIGDKAPKTAPVYNKVEEFADRVPHVAAPESDFSLHGGYKRRQVGEDYMYAGKVLEILAQKNAYSIALINNINAFYNAIQTEKIFQNQSNEIDMLKNTCNDLYKKITALEKKRDEEEKIKKS